MNAILTRPLGCDDWSIVETLFGPRGACGGCWCMWWRVPMGGRVWEAAKGEPNREAFRKLVNAGAASGVLAFVDDEAAGWCAIGPRAEFPRIDRSKSLVRQWSADTWSLNCLYVPPRWRGVGVARALVAAAVELARQRGATEVEAYPQSWRRGSGRPERSSGPASPRCMSRWGFAGRANQDVAAPCPAEAGLSPVCRAAARPRIIGGFRPSRWPLSRFDLQLESS